MPTPPWHSTAGKTSCPSPSPASPSPQLYCALGSWSHPSAHPTPIQTLQASFLLWGSPLSQPSVRRHLLQSKTLLGENVSRTSPSFPPLALPGCLQLSHAAAQPLHALRTGISPRCCGIPRVPRGPGAGACPRGRTGLVPPSAPEPLSTALNAALFAHGPGSHCHPVMNGASARRNTLFVLEVSVTLKGILHTPNQGVGADVTRVASARGAPGSSHCPQWEQSSFEDLTHKLSDTPPLSASSPLPL